jgi:tape measure domain-containing protein
MLTVPVKFDVNAGELQAALKQLQDGSQKALQEILDFNGKKVNIEYNFTSNGSVIAKELSEQEVAIRKANKAYLQSVGGQQNSVARTKKQIQVFKKLRDELNQNNPKWKQYSAAVKIAEDKLKKLQGATAGSLDAIRNQRSELVRMRNAVAMNSPEFKKLTLEIKKLDDRFTQTAPKAKSFFSVLGKIAVAQAAFAAVTGTVRSAANALGAFTARAKELEAFNLAVKNVGFTQAETNRIFKQAETTANRLGAPLQQVEKSYKRMIPALKAVGTSAADSDKFIAAISARSQTLGLNTEQSGRLLEAFAQVLSKGKLQAEELNQQISELDGAFRTQFADALGVSSAALNELISDSKITADVFVKTVNKMQNGVDALAKRIKNGTATIQQLQNAASNIETKNLESIAKTIEPAIKAFLEIRLAVAEFIKEFKETKTFDFLATTFNQIAKSARTLIDNILKLVLAVSQLLAPITGLLDGILSLDANFGGLIGILAHVVAGFLVFKGAIIGAMLIGKLKVLVTLTTVAFKGLFVSSKQAAVGMNLATFSTKRLLVGLRALGQAMPFLAIAAGVGMLVNAFRASGKAAQEIRSLYSGTFSELSDALAETSNKAEKLPANIGKATKTIKKASAESEYWGGVTKRLAVTLLAVGAATAVIATGGGALIIGATAQAAVMGSLATKTLLAAGAAGTLAAAYKTQEAAEAKLADSGRGKAILEQRQEFNDEVKEGIQRVKDLGGEVGMVDFSGFASGSENLKRLRPVINGLNSAVQTQIDKNNQIIKQEEEKKLSGKGNIDQIKATIELKEGENKQLRAFQVLTKRSVKGLQDETAARIRNGDAAAKAEASVEQLQKAQKQLNEEINTDLIEAQTEAIKKYGKEANAASLLAASNIAAEVVASERRTQLAKDDLAVLAKRGKLNEEEIALQRQLTNVVATETQKQAQLGIDARNAVINAFKAGIAEVDGQVDIILQSSSKLKGAFDGVSGTFVSGLQAANGLIDEIASRELKGLEVGSAKRKQIIERQLRAQAVTNEIENRIAVLKLTTQNKIATSQARIEQIKLRNAAKIAQAEGKSGLAKAYNEAANQQGLIIQGLGQQFRIEKELLGIQKATKDQKLINKGLDEELSTSAQGVANKLNVQLVSLKEAENKQKNLIKLAGDYGTAIAGAATDTQNTAEALQGTSLENGIEEAKKITNALENAQGAGDGLNAVMNAAKDTMSGGAGEASKIVGFLEAAVGEAGELQRIVLRGGSARAMGGPVTSGKQYTVNDGGGREGFLSNSGKFSMLPAARNMQWTAPTSGTVIPANLVNDFISASSSEKIQSASSGIRPKQNPAANTTSDGVSGNLVKQMTAALTGSGGNQRITNNVTIQSQQPVTDASKIMTNVARMRLRNGRRI